MATICHPTITHIGRIVDRARQLYESGDFRATLEVLAPLATETTPPQLLFFVTLIQGAAYFQLSDYHNALISSLYACKLRPDLPEPYCNIGNVYKEMGNLETAIHYYVTTLQVDPKFAQAHGNLGAVYLLRKDNDKAIFHYNQAIVLAPDSATWLNDLGHLYRCAERFAEAKRCFADAVTLDPHCAIAWSNLACVDRDLNDFPAAIEHYQRAIALDPTFVDAYGNLGNVLKDSGRRQEAVVAYANALKLDPHAAVIAGNYAAVLMELSNLEDAIVMFEYALALKPDFPDCWSNYGNALKLSGKLPECLDAYCKCLELTDGLHPDALNNAANAYKEMGNALLAEQLYRKAITLRGDFAGAHSNLGNLLKEQHRLMEALAEYQAALSIDPYFPDAWSNMGNCLKDMNCVSDAIAAYCKAIELRPTFADAYGNLASAYKDVGQLKPAVHNYKQAIMLKPHSPDGIAYCNLVHCLQSMCDWNDRDTYFRELERFTLEQMTAGRIPAVQPHHALVYPLHHSIQLRIAAHYADAALQSVTSAGHVPRVWGCESSVKQLTKHKRIRLGFISSDFGNHPLSHLMLHVLLWLDQSIFEVFCYATSDTDGSSWRQRIECGVENFRNVSRLPHADLAQMIHDDDISVLVNLNGYTKGSRNEVFALRPAPIQVMYLGYPGSSGSTYMQYLIADRVVVPPDMQYLCTERLAYMPNSYFVNDHAQTYADCAEELSEDEINRIRFTLGLPPRPAIVFCMPNQLYKIDPVCLAAWVDILKAVPGSVLWLLRFPPDGEENIRNHVTAAGLDAHRLVFTDVAPKEEHIRRSRVADLFLDSLLCNGHTTGTDVLWAGVPLITTPGATFAARVGASLATALGCPELVAISIDDYVAKAVCYARNLKMLRQLQQKVRTRRSVSALYDTRKWTRDFQALLGGIVTEHLVQCRAGINPSDAVELRGVAAYACGDPGAVNEPSARMLSPVVVSEHTTWYELACRQDDVPDEQNVARGSWVRAS